MTKNNVKTQIIRGMICAIPVVLGFIPVGIAYAIMARQAGFSVWQTCGMSLTVFAGASQMMVIGMYEQGAAVIAMIIATFILNFRHLIMGTCIFSRMQKCSAILKIISAYGVTDESFALFTTEKEERCTIFYFIGMNVVMYASWNVGTFIGAVASDFLPVIVTASLGISLYAMFIGLLLPGIKGNSRLCVLVVLTAVCNLILTQFISSGEALIISALICSFAGVFFVDIDEEKKEADTDGQH